MPHVLLVAPVEPLRNVLQSRGSCRCRSSNASAACPARPAGLLTMMPIRSAMSSATGEDMRRQEDRHARPRLGAQQVLDQPDGDGSRPISGSSTSSTRGSCRNVDA